MIPSSDIFQPKYQNARYETPNNKYCYTYNPDQYDTQIICYGYEQTNSDKATQYKIFESFSMHLIASGSGFIRIGSKEQELKENSVFIIYPDTPVSYRQNPENPWEYYWINFIGAFSEDLLARCNLTKETPIIRDINPIVFKILQDFFNNSDDRFSKDLTAIADFYKILSYLVKPSVPLKKTCDNKQIYILEAIEMIKNGYERKKLTTSFVSNQLCLHPNYFSRIFKETTKKSFGEYLTDYRLAKACDLLKTTTMPATCISHSTGFSSPAYFFRQFKNKFGLSPMQFRNNVLL